MTGTSIKIAAIALVALGILALVYGGFTYTSDVHDADIGPIEFQIKEKDRVNIPIWAGVGSIVVGAGLLLMKSRK